MVSLVDPLLCTLAGAVAVILLSRLVKKDLLFGLIALASLAASSVPLILSVSSLPMTFSLDGFGSPAGVVLYADSFSIFMAFLFLGLAILAVVYSLRYMELEDGLDKYYALLLLLVSGLLGVVFSGDLFTLFVFWELMSISSYALVSFRNSKWEPLEAGFKYLVMSTVGALIALYGISIVYGMTGTLNIQDIILRMPTLATPQGYFALTAIVAGFGVTAAIVPFHSWLPDAHPAAPTPVSALLSGVVIKAGIFVIFRILFFDFAPSLYDFGTILIALGLLTVTVANVMVFSQRDIKRFLAYSSISNIGLIIVAGGVAAYILRNYPASTPIALLAMAGAILHIFNHAVGKGLLFLGSGCFIHAAESREISDLEGIGRVMPYSGASFTIGLFHLAGVPPLGGFWSKLLIILAPITLISDPILAVTAAMLVINSLMAGGYYVWLAQRISFREPRGISTKPEEAPLLMLAPVVLLAAVCILVTLFLPNIIAIASSIASGLLG